MLGILLSQVLWANLGLSHDIRLVLPHNEAGLPLIQSYTAFAAVQSCLPALPVVSMVILLILSCHFSVTVVSMVLLPIISCHQPH
jgi:hypothetical protein